MLGRSYPPQQKTWRSATVFIVDSRDDFIEKIERQGSS
jgi:hypothetical protein